MRREPFWVAVVPYWNPERIDGRLRGRFAPGAFGWEGAADWPEWWCEPWPDWWEPGADFPTEQLRGLHTPAPVCIDHRYSRRAGWITDWRDRADMLYARVELDDEDDNYGAKLAWNALWHASWGVISPGSATLADEDGPMSNERRVAIEGLPEHEQYEAANGVVTKAGLIEVTICCTRHAHFRETRMLTAHEAERMLADESFVLAPMDCSHADLEEEARRFAELRDEVRRP